MDKWNTWKITGEEKNTTVLFQIMSFSLLQRKQSKNKTKYAIYVVSLHFFIITETFPEDVVHISVGRDLSQNSHCQVGNTGVT